MRYTIQFFERLVEANRGWYVADVNLTKVERALLLNQYRILEIICPEKAESYIKCQEILERGYQLFYDKVVDVWDELSSEDSQHIFDVLDVFRLMKLSYEGLTDKSGIDPEALKFKGFDSYNETKLGLFLHYLTEIGRYPERANYFNSGRPMGDSHHLMVKIFKAIKATHGEGWNYKMTKKEIQHILKAGELREQL
jgi:uncharacterized protein YfbU (UPF0304 family)